MFGKKEAIENLTDEEKKIIKSYSFLTLKPIIYLANVKESELGNIDNEYVKKVVALTEKYQSLFGPLTVNFTSDTWDWINEPWPWERGAY